VRPRVPGRAFSLVELVIVLVIIGVIAAIAVPRLTHGATNASAIALKSDLAALRHAIELYRAEHEGALPTVAKFTAQMTKFSNAAGGSFAATASVAEGIIYGPYLKAIPPLPVGAQKGQTAVIGPSDNTDAGWVYTQSAGDIAPNTTASELDRDGIQYDSY
jgi:general secretion pathway protein G